MLQKDLDIFKKHQSLFRKARHVFYVRADYTSPHQVGHYFFPVHPYILSKHADNQPVNNERTSPHPPFIRASQVPSQSAFSLCLSEEVLRMKGG